MVDHAMVGDVAALLGRGMADNPLHRVVYGTVEADAARAHARLMRVLVASPRRHVDVVEHDGTLVGVAASAPPGGCRPSSGTRLRLLAAAAPEGPRVAARLVSWTGEWARHDPAEPHVHLGPVSVDRHLRGRGIGGVLLARHTRSLDASGAVGYLETDRPEAVGFYRRFGYDVVEASDVLGVRCWFMRRAGG
ncbi:GNAT family N-acetyltransferase [Cellulosimicrobium sp. PMB13]|uniref:GNAT family N-acetyltransferase n=1 Tax=Cellulosimicrobium sp. PMB13 TaxID=3120158 RepID=UPI003F4B7A2F